MVLSTSKNAAAVGSAGTVSAASTSAAAQPAAGSISFVDGAWARAPRRRVRILPAMLFASSRRHAVGAGGRARGAIGSSTVQDVRNVADLARRAATGDGADRPALCWHDRALTWGELDKQADAVATGLRAVVGGSDEPVAPRVAIALP